MRNSVLIAAALCASAAVAQQQPLSAIDWLEQQNSVPLAEPIQAPAAKAPPATPEEPPAVTNAEIEAVEVTPIGQALPDSVGLLPTATTGLPRNLWQASQSTDIEALFAQAQPDMLPAMQALSYTLLLAEADAPRPGPVPVGFLKSRIQTLVRFGAVDPARALIERAGPNRPELFDLWLSLSLLSGDEDSPCAALQQDPGLSRDYAARIFCIARAGDWPTAALTYDTATALGTIQGPIAVLLEGFLDPEAISDPGTTPPRTPTALMFRLYEANGTPLPTTRLPLAFSMSDLRGNSGWKPELEAAERLARTGALPASRLIGLYTDRSPAASGGVWDRVRAVQALDEALFDSDGEVAARALPTAWEAMRARGLAVPFADLFAQRLLEVPLPARARPLAMRIALLSRDYEEAGRHFPAQSDADRLLQSIAAGTPDPALAQTALEKAVVAGLTTEGPAAAHQPMLDAGQLGQAILTATLQLGQGRTGRERDVTEGLATLRHVGLEDTVRRAALQLLVLDP